MSSVHVRVESPGSVGTSVELPSSPSSGEIVTKTEGLTSTNGSSALADNPEGSAEEGGGVDVVGDKVVVRFLTILLPKGPDSLARDPAAVVDEVDCAGLARTGAPGTAELSVKFPSSNWGLKKMVSSGKALGDAAESARLGFGGRPASSMLKRTTEGVAGELAMGRTTG